jgi:phosphohistidine phosphatase
MKIIFVRHAQAQPRESGMADADRKLVKDGRQQARTTAKALAALGEQPEQVLTSPLARARETAEELIDVWGVKNAENLPELSTDFDAPAVDRVLVGLLEDGVGCVCLVGHAPTLGDYIARLVGVKAGLSETIDLTKSGAGCVEIEKPSKPLIGTLKWLLRRDQLAELAGKG